ncbi:AsmA family protein [Methylobacterium sp. J-078]|uniref:AsmA family protein n=1 Tax=Methylobacterium sp. J-078 TaxID=2836657 RepID=UPI001FB93582|nr:AsmA family protein [Methylobacterium sp. J-078]MCJ2048056.1 AsmA family protein [Methylobacterium sp. J-078]
MRDLLTALAGAVILLLVAALAVPPFVAWEGYRGLLDRTIGRSLGIEVHTEGRIGLRLLPSPRLKLDRLRLGPGATEKPGGETPGLDLHWVRAEVALAPLLKGEVRFTETRIGRAEVKLPVSEGEGVLVPAEGWPAATRDLAIEDLAIRQFVLTTQVPATGRTEQFYAEALQVSAPALLGPWRVEGTSRGVPFRIATGEAGADGVAVKISGGGDTQPRFEADARITLAAPKETQKGAPAARAAALKASGQRILVPEAEGSARIVVGPPVQAAGAYLPFSLGGKFTGRGLAVAFSDVALEIDPGGQALRLGGTGRLDLRQWRGALALGARRLDLDAFLTSAGGQALIARGLPTAEARGTAARGWAGLPIMLDLDLAVETLALGLDEWSGLALSATLDRTGGLVLRRLDVTAPGAAVLGASGEIDTTGGLRFSGHLSLDTPASDGLGRYLRRLGLEGPAVAVLDGRPVQLGTDLSVAAPSLSLRNLRLNLGEARITGNARYTAAEGTGRGRFDAQLVGQGIDIAALPSLSGALAELKGHDLGLTLQARDVHYGPAGAHSGNGTIAASIQSDGAGLAVDSLDITDLAGANARLSGRIAPDGTGRIAGRVSAAVAAPLFALLDRVWIAEARGVPAFLRAGALDLAVSLERDAGAADTLRVGAKGDAAGGTLDLDLLSRAGRIAALDLTVAAPDAAPWFGRPDLAALRRPGRLRLVGAEVPALPGAPEVGLALRLTGTVADLTVATVQPLLIAAGEPFPRAGELQLSLPDLAPFLTLAGSTAPSAGPWPAELGLRLSRAGADARVAVVGRIAGQAVSADLTRAPSGEIGGSATLARLSLPLLARATILPVQAPRGSGQDPASLRFAPAPEGWPPVALALRVDALDLGRGLTATGAGFSAALDGDTLALRDLSGALAGGRIAGSATLSRQGGAAAISGEGQITDAGIAELAGGGPVAGRVTAQLRFGTSGESATGLTNNLGGSGTLTLSGLGLPGADPAGLPRALTRALAEDDPLREGRLQALVAEELGAGPLGTKGPVTSPVSLVGGALRTGPLTLDLGAGRWTGTLGLDLRDARLDARGSLTAAAVPKGWSGAAPSIQLGFGGPLRAPERSLDAGAATNGLAALVLQRELEKIELFEADQTERARRRGRIEMDKARAAALKAAADRAAAEKAAAEKAAAEEAARQARLRAQQAAEKAAEEAAAKDAAAREAARRQRSEPEPPQGGEVPAAGP